MNLTFYIHAHLYRTHSSKGFKVIFGIYDVTFALLKIKILQVVQNFTGSVSPK